LSSATSQTASSRYTGAPDDIIRLYPFDGGVERAQGVESFVEVKMVFERYFDDVTRTAKAAMRFSGAGDDGFGDFRTELDEQRAILVFR
jgi:hypothetical protein